MTPYIADVDFSLYVGDVRDVLKTLEAESIDCCVTSPPYLGLRDYGHESQIGLEGTLGEYVATMVDVFREVRRVLTPTATCWLNLGDSYNAYNGGAGPGSKLSKIQTEARPRLATGFGLQQKELKPKDLMGVPWRVALALQDDGWYLRSDIIWSKPNPMPESVTDRPTKAHEYVFLLSKSPRYFFDADAIREPATFYGPNGANGSRAGTPHHGQMLARSGNKNRKPNPAAALGHGDTSHGIPWEGFDRNARTVWEIATRPYSEAHFATFPEELPRRCIAAGCPDFVCMTCGKPRERITETSSTYEERKALGYDKPQNMVVGGHPGHHNGLHPPGMSHDLTPKARVDRGWSDCGHNDYRPGTVLDPFMGSGTTALVARRLGRKSVGIELNPEYAALAAKRLQQLSLLAEDVA